ncbi:hypothetical protein MNBD_BACTEROID01-111, partial [hydrothermal vent metagenome]
EGLAYRLVPIKSTNKGIFTGRIDADILYDNVMNKFVWGNITSPDVYIDDYNEREIRIIQARYIFARLAQQLTKEGKKDSAIAVIDRLIEIFPNERIPFAYDSFPAAEQYYAAGAMEKGDNMVRTMAQNSFDNIEYYLSTPFFGSVKNDLNREISNLRNLTIITRNYKQNDLSKELDQKLQAFIAKMKAKSEEVRN